MLSKTEAIVLGSVKYSDSSLILKCYTRENGLQSFIVGNTHSKKGPIQASMAQPLTQLELVYYEKSKGELKRIREALLTYNYQTILYDPAKRCLAFFIAEVLRRVIHEEVNPKLFDFLNKAFIWLDFKESPTANFHLLTLYKMTSFLGFEPASSNKEGRTPYFDLISGNYSIVEPKHVHVISGQILEHWQRLSKLEFENLGSYKTDPEIRAALLKRILNYYRLHVKSFGGLRSEEIIRVVLHGI